MSSLIQAVEQLKNTSTSRAPVIEIHALGKCPGGHGSGKRVEDKIGTFAKYKFCLTFENNLVRDYVTERLFDAFVAGCLPVYFGAPNIRELLPSPDAAFIIGSDSEYRSDPVAFLGALSALAADRTAYEARLAWRKLPPDMLAPGFLRLLSAMRAEDSHVRKGRASGLWPSK